MKMMKPCLAELLGTFFLCFAGIAAILSNTKVIGSGAGLVGIALAHGLALSVAVNAFGGISGAHFNPAVSIGMLVTGRIDPIRTVCYIVSQCLGAVVAAIACRAIFPSEAVDEANLGIPLPRPGTAAGVVFVAEFIMTFLLLIAIYGTAIDERGRAVKIGGFGIGLTVAFDILAGGALTGASMNPARSFGPALVAGNFDKHILYWIAPILGGCTAALLYHHVLLPEDDKETKEIKR
jgi:MIP family channel proteins